MEMSIAAMSVGLSEMKMQQELGISVMKMAMNSSLQGADELLSELEASIDPNLGNIVDIQA
ncbi:hypothetical protein TAMA11512_10070 [Selenomonas sp. TAMA-11512]|uniref:YjfB family protein n=1 Tax=Selenomonas sp. TAMA-11512 TaxID=3095337 RepID=UPI0030916A42|nr:hypothetical protein TAMA11512_10070 [Selenomonas sp. TAMA-11512]